MESSEKRTAQLLQPEVQRGNQAWWSDNPMAYDWRDENKDDRFSLKWFDEMDRRFLHGSRLFATREVPFDQLIPYERLRGARVLEIGCGMGLHSELLARAGADLTSIDISPTSIDATRRRLSLRGLHAETVQMDAEQLQFDDRSFDFVWSWGVIHHSSRTARVVREIARILKKSGETRVMVYNREGLPARLTLLKEHVLRGGFLKRSFEETLYMHTDGFTARYYVAEQFEDLFRAFFDDVSSQVLGQDADAIPLPRKLRVHALRWIPENYVKRAQARRGGFIFLRAGKLV